MKLFIIISSIIVILVILFLVVLRLIYNQVFYNKTKNKNNFERLLPGKQYEPFYPRMRSEINYALNEPCENVYITSKNGLKLHARFFDFDSNNPIFMEFHGYKGNGIRDLASGVEYDKNHGVSMFMIDLRAHGTSEGNNISFGIKEREDVLTWVEYLNNRFNGKRPIYLYGVSMGAATILMASSYTYPKAIKGIIADCPYSSPKLIIQKVSKEMKFNPKLVWPFIKLSGKIYGHFNIDETTALKEVKKATLPMIIIHGTDDRFVPYQMSEDLVKENPNIKLYLVENAPHGLSFYYDIDLYTKAIFNFIEETNI